MAVDFEKYLKCRNFAKTLNKYKKIYKDKKIVIYGTGMLFESAAANYDFSGLNIIAVSDRKFSATKPDKYLGYETIAPDSITDLKPDVVLVGTLKSVAIVESLRYETLLNTGIKVYPLVEKGILEILKEIWY